MISSDMHCGHIVAAFRFDGVYERIRTGREAIVGRERQKWSLREASRSAIESKLFAVRAHLVGHPLGRDAGQGLHVICHHGHKALARDVGLGSHVSSGNKDGADQIVIVCGGVYDHPSAHAVASNGDTMSVNAEARGV